MQQLHLQPGALLQAGKYRIEKILGQGGFGITYLATQELLNRRVAVKEFFMRDFCSRAQDTATVTLGTDANREQMERYLAKFLKEAKVIAQLDHPNIIRIYDIFEENGTAYYVMEYIEGESLSQLVKRRGALPEQEAIEYIRSVAEALKHVHSFGINHLDVKPGNIMVRRKDGRVFLLDFGLSKQYDAEGNQTSSTPLGISHGYAPIEQYTPGGMKEFSPQTDIYALGATLYYLVTGNTPPPAGELFTHKLEGFPPTVSSALRRAIGRAMRQQREDRPATVEKFEALLPAQGQPKKKSGNRRPPKNDLGDDDETTRLNPEADETPEGEGTPRRNGFGRFFQSNRKKIALISAGVIALAIVCGVLYTSQPSYIHKQGLAAFNTGDYATAVVKFGQAAEKGYADSQYRLGHMYYNGEGVTKNDTWAAHWFTQAAEQGYAAAQLYLGDMYSKGAGVARNDTTAVEWYTRAAKQGHPTAQIRLGEMYESGRGVKRDYAQAMECYTQAANPNRYNNKAYYHLGEMYYYGRGVPQDYEKALEQYQMATIGTGYAPAQLRLREMYKYGRGVPKDEAKAAEWYAKAVTNLTQAAEQGDAEAQFKLGEIHELGSVTPAPLKALEWYMKAAEQGYIPAQTEIGNIYYFGSGVPKDLAKAEAWYTKAAEQGDAEALFRLGQIYYYPAGETDDQAKAQEGYDKAKYWFTQAAEQGHINAQYILGYMYQDGVGMPRDYDKAREWYNKIVEQSKDPDWVRHAKARLEELENH